MTSTEPAVEETDQLESRDEQVTQGCETVVFQWNVPSLTKIEGSSVTLNIFLDC